jgi:hypothetical protein
MIVRVNTNGVTDLAGNRVNFFQGSFTTVATADTTGPAVIAGNAAGRSDGDRAEQQCGAELLRAVEQQHGEHGDV